MNITFTQKGNFSRTRTFLERAKSLANMSILDKYGRMGVEALASATPKDSGETAASWGYKIEKDGSGLKIVWSNSHINDGVNIAVILQYGHGTGTGGYVAGVDYINPAVKPVFDKMAFDLRKELKF